MIAVRHGPLPSLGTSNVYLKIFVPGPESDVPFPGRSDALLPTPVPYGANVRAFYLSSPDLVPPPVISASEFVPYCMVEHLMRNKKDRAIGVKFEAGNNPPDQITNMEAAMHTYVTPIVPANLHGDYQYRPGHHAILRFPPTSTGMDQARHVIVSASIHPDFENDEVMMKLASLTELPTIGSALPPDFEIPSAQEKQDTAFRAAYDSALRAHMIEHLVSDRRLPSYAQAQSRAVKVEQAIEAFEEWIKDSNSAPHAIQDAFVRLLTDEILSVELLYNSALNQLRNELSVLDIYFPQGYVYTFDPPSIFAQRVDATLLNRLLFAALKTLSKQNHFRFMRVFAFNNYADREGVSVLKQALASNPKVAVLPKSSLFLGPGASYQPPKGAEGALLVLHNNSDGFGQNIETEAPGGSMDGAIGAYSSVAASLQRQRADLLRYVDSRR